jgi:putative toxin-antitoxin system antitoxin component (TIGR02293 family)
MLEIAEAPESLGPGLLGVERTGGDPRLRLVDAIVEGLSVSALDDVARAVAPDDAGFKFRISPRATLERRRRSGRLSTEESDRLARVAAVWSLAREVFGAPETARRFLGAPHAMLEGRAPLDVALAAGVGAEVVINILGRAAYGAAV